MAIKYSSATLERCRELREADKAAGRPMKDGSVYAVLAVAEQQNAVAMAHKEQQQAAAIALAEKHAAFVAPTFQQIEAVWVNYLEDELQPQTAQRWSECPIELVENAIVIASEKLPYGTTEKKAAAYVTGILQNSVIGTARQEDFATGTTTKATCTYLTNQWHNADQYKEKFPVLFAKEQPEPQQIHTEEL